MRWIGKNPRNVHWLVLFIALVISYGAGFIGSLFSRAEINSGWYQSVKPIITPPAWIFPVVWNIIFLLIAVSFWMAWKMSGKKEKIIITLIYGFNIIVNAFWSYFYLGLHAPLLAFYDLIFIWASIIALILLTFKISKTASVLLLPYLAWVSFAAVLNYLSIQPM